MNYNTLVSCQTLNTNLNKRNWIIFDCRFSLADAEAGAKAYRMGHIPGARYADLDHDLSSLITSFTGRHPLPDFRTLEKKLAQWGVTSNCQVVVYDHSNGAFAARLWWLLRVMGHEHVAVLDGGITQWQKQGLQLSTVLPKIQPKRFRAYVNQSAWVSASQLGNGLASKHFNLIDARTPERFRGEQEPIDTVAGHIPYAINRPFQLNLDTEGCFLSAKILRQQFKLLLNNQPAEQAVHMCGSGVTACHNLLAMEYARLSGSKLYPGSWSEWIRNPNRPISPIL